MDINRLTQIQVATLLECTERSIDIFRKQAADPLPFHQLPGQFKTYVWSECKAWLLRKEGRKAVKAGGNAKDDIDAAKLEGQNLANEKTQIEIDIRKGQLLEVADVRAVWADGLVGIKQGLLNVGHVAATDIVDGMSYAKKKDIIDRLNFANLEKVISDAQQGAA